MVTLRRILCAVEMRLDDINVLACACLIARPFGARVDTLLLRRGHGAPTSTSAGAERPREIDAGREAEHLFAELLASTPGSPMPDFITGGDSRSVLQRSEEYGSDLIVLGSRPAGVEVDETGTIAHGISRSAACAVMTVPTPARSPSVSRILLPVDFSEATERAVDWTRIFAQQFSATVHLLHAVGSGALRGATVRGGRSIRTGVGQAQAQLGEIERRLRAARVNCESSIAQQGTTHAILDCRDRHDSDLIVMGLHHPENGSGALAREVAPGMVATIRSRSPVPLLSMTTPASQEHFAFGDSLERGVDSGRGQALSGRAA